MWLLCAALPLQGASAATMALCGPGTSHDHVAMSSTAPASGHEHHAAEVDHHHAAAEPAADAAEPSDGTGPQKCSVCASCCVGAGAVQRLSFFEPVALPDSFALPVGSGIAVYLTGGLERPPRSFLV